MKGSRALSRGRLVDLVTNRKTNLSIEKEAFLILFLCLQIWCYCQEWGKKLPFFLFLSLGFQFHSWRPYSVMFYLVIFSFQFKMLRRH